MYIRMNVFSQKNCRRKEMNFDMQGYKTKFSGNNDLISFQAIFNEHATENLGIESFQSLTHNVSSYRPISNLPTRCLSAS